MPFCGQVYAVNPKSKTIMGLPCYPTLRDVPGPIDHVMTSVPATVLPAIVEDCGAKGVKVIHFFTSGLREN
jgi:acetyltransferase